MAYKIQFTPKTSKQFSKLDKTAQKRLQDAFTKIRYLDNPRSIGKALQGDLAGIWRYRVGDYRILVRIVDETLLILVLAVEHRSTVYN